MGTNRISLAIWPLLLVLPIMLTGCAQPEPDTTDAAPTAIPATPAFASEEEALAAAEQAYDAYLLASDSAADQDNDSQAYFLSLSTGSVHKEDAISIELFETQQWQQTGTVTFDSMRLQSSAQTNLDAWEIRVYACLDVSQTDVLDSQGLSTIPSDRPLRMPLEISFVTLPNNPDTLLISESTVWSGTNFC
jgi:hypothetical protein